MYSNCQAISPRELEEQIRKVERIEVVIGLPDDTPVGEYGWERAARRKWTVNRVVEERIRPLVGSVEITVLDEEGDIAAPQTHVANVEVGCHMN